jgi:hypothetical protein
MRKPSDLIARHCWEAKNLMDKKKKTDGISATELVVTHNSYSAVIKAVGMCKRLWNLFVCLFCLTHGFNPPSFSFTPSLSRSDLRSALRKKTIVFIGDSVTRYQYLNLAFFLERGKWPGPLLTDEEMDGNPCCEKSFKDLIWERFYFQTNSALHGNELCDCWRVDGPNMIENRRYYHPKLKTHLIFIWFGTAPIHMRQDFASFPFRHLGNLYLPSNQKLIPTIFDTFTVAKIVENATMSFNPNFLFLNWGHHHTYYSDTPGGRLVYHELATTLNKLKSSGLYQTRFIFKKTSPFCISPVYSLNHSILSCSLQPKDDPYDPKLLCNKLIEQRHMESFDINYYITLLSRALPSFRDPFTGQRTISAFTPIEEAYPLYWDTIHPHCWVMTQLNRVLIATYFTSSKFDGVSSGMLT